MLQKPSSASLTRAASLGDFDRLSRHSLRPTPQAWLASSKKRSLPCLLNPPASPLDMLLPISEALSADEWGKRLSTLLHRYRGVTENANSEEDIEKAFRTLDLFCVADAARISLENFKTSYQSLSTPVKANRPYSFNSDNSKSWLDCDDTLAGSFSRLDLVAASQDTSDLAIGTRMNGGKDMAHSNADATRSSSQGSSATNEVRIDQERNSTAEKSSKVSDEVKATPTSQDKPPLPLERRATQPSRIPRLDPGRLSSKRSIPADKPLPKLPNGDRKSKPTQKRRSLPDAPRQTRTSLLRAQQSAANLPKKSRTTSNGSPIPLSPEPSHKAPSDEQTSKSPNVDGEDVKATISRNDPVSSGSEATTFVEAIDIPEDPGVQTDPLDRIDSDSDNSDGASVILPTSPRSHRLPSNGSNSDFTKVDETSTSGYRVKRLSTKAPNQGPQLKISEVADDIIMGHGAFTDHDESFQAPPSRPNSRIRTRLPLPNGVAKPDLLSSSRKTSYSSIPFRNRQEGVRSTGPRTRMSQASACSSLAFPARTSSLAPPTAPGIGTTVSKASSGIKGLFKKKMRSIRSVGGSPRKARNAPSRIAQRSVDTEKYDPETEVPTRPSTQNFPSRGHAYVARLQDAAATASDTSSQVFFSELAGVTGRALECREFAREAHDRAQREASAAYGSAVAAKTAAAEAKTHANLANDIFFDAAKLVDHAARERKSTVM